jgi:cell division ATPase FtsA
MPEYLAKIFDDPTLKEDIEIIEVLPKGYCAALAVTRPEQRKIGIIVINASETSLDYAVCQDDKWIAIGSAPLAGKGYGEATSLIFEKLSQNHAFPTLPEVIVTGLNEAQEAIRKVVQEKTKQPCKAGDPTCFHGTDIIHNADHSVLLGVIRHGILQQPPYKSSVWGDFTNLIGDIWSDIRLYWRIRRELRKRKDQVVAK